MAYGTIDIGSAASNRSTYQAISWFGNYYTYVERGNVANAAGILNSCEIYMQSTGANIRVGTFSASGANLTRRDYEVLGSVTSGSKQTFTGLNITVSANDLIGTTGTDGNIEGDGTGSSVYHAHEGSQNYTFFDTSAHNYSNGNGPISLYGTGITVPDPPTNVSATSNLTDKVRITWTPGAGETAGHRVYRDGDDISGVLDHVERTVMWDNGGWETWVDANTPTYGSIQGVGGSVDRESTIKKTGSYSIKITAAAEIKQWHIDDVDQGGNGTTIAWWKGKTVTQGVWAYCDTYHGCRLGFWDGNDGVQDVYHNGTGWEYLVNTLYFDNDATHVYIYCTAMPGITAYFDSRSAIFTYGVAGVHDGVNGLCIPYDDSSADAPATLAGGTSDASDGTETAKVVLSVSGQGVNHGTSHSYTVKAINAAGDSAASTADVGYRISTETLTYQWYRSAADSDADYSAIDGGTTNPYNDTGAP